VSWEHCYDEETEASAIQHAYNALIDDGPEAFASEYQNEPLPQATSTQALSVDQIVRKINGYSGRQIPQDAQRLTAFIDVQKDVLYYAVCAWSDNFTGYVVDYGCYPDQKRDHFALRDARYTLADAHPGTGLEGSLFAGLDALTNQLFQTTWVRDDGSNLAIERLLIDANWGDSTETVYRFCRQSPYIAALLPSHGKFISAASGGFNLYKPRPGERRGLNWRIPPLANGKPVRHVVYDANFWKSFFFKRLSTPIGDSGSLTLFKASATAHAMLAEHLVSEIAVAVTAHGRTVEEWRQRPNHPDNHLLDCLVGCCVAASIQGTSLLCHREAAPRKRRRQVSYV
jgi:hypothetical protein